MPRWTVADITDQTGRTIIVTGANSGLGFQTARALARRGARVVLTARNEAKGADAIAKLRAEQPKADVELRLLDLADLDSVRAFAAAVAADELPVDVLINNAGIMMPPRTLTKQGFELQFGTNHLGHFALTGLLLGTLRRAERGGRDARIVTVSSTLHRNGTIHFDDLNGTKGYSPTRYYSQSKYANVLFALELDRRLRGSGSAIRSVLAHPGYSATNLQTTGPTGMLNMLMKVANPLFAQKAEHGALNELYAATDPRAEGGQFIGPDGMAETRGHPTVVQPVESAKDPEMASRLWTISEELTGVEYAF